MTQITLVAGLQVIHPFAPGSQMIVTAAASTNYFIVIDTNDGFPGQGTDGMAGFAQGGGAHMG